MISEASLVHLIFRDHFTIRNFLLNLTNKSRFVEDSPRRKHFTGCGFYVEVAGREGGTRVARS